MFMRVILLSLVATLAAGYPVSSIAQRAKSAPASASAPAPQPFDLTLGKSTLTETETIWKQQGATAGDRGYGEAKPSHRDNDPDGVPNERVVMVDTTGLPLERLEQARFGFFDNVLYFIRYHFQGGYDFDKLYRQVSAKYGPPTRRGGFGDEFFEWQFPQVVLTLNKNFFGRHSMMFVHEPTMKSVQASHAEVYARHIKAKAQRQKGF